MVYGDPAEHGPARGWAERNPPEPESAEIGKTGGRGARDFEARGRAGDYRSPSSLSSSSSSSSSSSATGFSSMGLTVTISKSVPHSGQETTSPSSTSSSSMSRSLSHSGQ